MSSKAKKHNEGRGDPCPLCGGSGVFTYRKAKNKAVVCPETGATFHRVWEKDKNGNVKIYEKPCTCQVKEKSKKSK